jgi:hypothetical protein
VVEEVRRLPGQATELAKLGLPTRDSVVVEEVPKFPGQATELATSGVPNPDSEVLGCLNEGSEKALDVQLHEALLHGHGREVSHGVTLAFIGVLLGWVRSLEYNLRQKVCEHILPNGEKAGKSSSEGNLAESSDAPYAEQKENFPGVRQRNNAFVSEIRLPGKKHKVWLGSYKTKEKAGQAFQVAADWREAHRDSKSFSEEEVDDLKKRAKKAGENLSDDRPHHNVASPAATVASSKGKAVASAEHVIQRESLSQENLFSPSEFEENASLKRKAVARVEHGIQWESHPQENHFSSSEFEEKATTSASLEGNPVASPEHASQWEHPAQELSPSDNLDWESFLDL